MYTWDYLAAEGFSVHNAANLMQCSPRTAFKELNLARERRYFQRIADLDAVSHILENPAYAGFHEHGAKGLPYGKTRVKNLREIRIPQSPV